MYVNALGVLVFEKNYSYPNGDEIIHRKALNGNLTTFIKNKQDGRSEVHQESGMVDEIPDLIKPYEVEDKFSMIMN